jgi:hypothetical protein
MADQVTPLVKAGGELVHLDKGTYQWVDIKQFEIDPSSPVSLLVDALIQSPAYNDDYAGGDEGAATPGLHGPYQQAAIKVTDFVPVVPPVRL